MSGAIQARNYYSKGQYEVTSPSGATYSNPKGTYWRFSRERFEDLDRDNRIYWGENGSNVPRIKRFLTDVRAGVVPQTLWLHTQVGHTQEAKEELLAFVDFQNTENVLNSVKPTRLLRHALRIGTTPDAGDVVLDFFAGSAPCAHAVLAQNAEDGGNRRFVAIQLPEPLPVPEDSLVTIADMAKSRVRKVIAKLNDEDAGKLDLDGGATADRGFRVFKLAESNFKPWNAQVAHDGQALEEQLDMHVDHVRGGRSNEDLLYEILLKSGFPLTTAVDTVSMAGKTVYAVAGGALFICLERELTLALIRTMAGSKPERVVCLDEGFAGNDQLKANAVQIFKTKGVTSFKTV